MADPREVMVEQRVKKEHLSPLMRAKARAKYQEVINACPYGCNLSQMDEHGYCKHLVGFTTDGKRYEPMVRRGGHRVVEVQMVEDPDQPPGEDGQPVKKPKLPLVKPDDKLVKITVSSRVYRDVDGQGERLRKRLEEEEREKRLEERRAFIAEIKEDEALRAEFLEALSAPKGELANKG